MLSTNTHPDPRDRHRAQFPHRDCSDKSKIHAKAPQWRLQPHRQQRRDAPSQSTAPTPPIRDHAHDAAVKAAATRKANKQKSAGTGEKIGADTKAPEPSDEPAVTE